MWFKQAQIFELSNTASLTRDGLEEALDSFAFRPCLPSLPSSHGWEVPIVDPESIDLVYQLNQCLIFNMKLEDKLLPASIVQHAVKEKVQEIETREARKLRLKEKQQLKEDMHQTLLPKAFSRFSSIMGYIDLSKNWLIINTSNSGKTEIFLTAFKRALPDISINPLELCRIPTIFSHWLLNDSYPDAMGLENSCLLQDPLQSSRKVRCQHQPLQHQSILELLKEGFEAVQLSLNWLDRMRFTLNDKFQLSGIRASDEVVADAKAEYSESPQQRWDTDFILLSNTFREFFTALLPHFLRDEDEEQINQITEAEAEAEAEAETEELASC